MFVQRPHSLTPPPLQLRQELPLTTISQLDTRDIVWCNAPKYEGRITPTCRFLTKRKKAEVVHRVFLGDYVTIYDASDPNLYMVTGVTWFDRSMRE